MSQTVKIILSGLLLTGVLAQASQAEESTMADHAPAAALPEDGWISLFDGHTLNGWIPKVRGYETGLNPLQTFRAENGLLSVNYAGYEAFEDRFGHLFYKVPYSHYRLRLEYRFIGDAIPGTPGWALRNSGAMLHAQAPDSMNPDQDFPISIEFQFLGGLSDGQARPTGNLCTPGTHVELAGVLTEEHCINSRSPTFHGDQWVTAEAIVLGSEQAQHLINGESVLAYGGLMTGGGVVSGHDPELKPERAPLARGYIALQSEGHPIEFRNIQLLNLKGCMDPEAAAYRPHFTVSDPTTCAD